MPEPVKFERVPPLTTTSPTPKVVEAALRVKVISAVSVRFTSGLLEMIVTVGAGALSASDTLPAVLKLPRASVKAPAGTVTVPTTTVLVLGVKVAV